MKEKEIGGIVFQKFRFISIGFIGATLISCSPGYRLDSKSQSSTHDGPDTVVMGDMILDRSLLEANSDKVTTQGSSGFLNYQSRQWKNGKMPIKFHKGISSEMKSMFFQACQEWSRFAKVRCTEKGLFDFNYLNVYSVSDPGVCTSTVGIQNPRGRKDHMNLGTGCWYPEIIMHELGHAFGLIHEHQRPDRDSYIEVVIANVTPEYQYALSIIDTGRNLTAYDFNSIMHYDAFAFSADHSQRTIIPKHEYEQFKDSIGKATFPSDLDGETLAAIYGRP